VKTDGGKESKGLDKINQWEDISPV
jgi:hypothetical protein